MDVYQENMEIFHGNIISLEEWQRILSSNDKDQQNFIIFYGTVPLARLRINGLLNLDMAWISMLVVSRQYHRKGIGRYAIKFLEEFVSKKGFQKIGIHTTDDNIPAQNLYRKCGYDVINSDMCAISNAVNQITFAKMI